MRPRFLEGAAANGVSRKDAERIFEQLFAFTGYGFNKSHSAAYAIPAYHTIWLKANHPAEFIAANCTNDINDTDRLAQLIREAREMGIEVLPPDVNLSQKQFGVEGGKIVFGLMGIKNVGSGAVDAIIEEREKGGPFKSFLDFFDRIDSHEVNRKVAEGLVITGAFDRLGVNRATLMHNLPRVTELSAKAREARRYGQASLFQGASDAPSAALELERQPEWPAAQLLEAERQNMGFFFSGHPLDPYKAIMERAVNVDLSKKETLSNERACTLVGSLSDVREIRTRGGRAMAFANLADFHGSIECIIFSDVYEARRALIVNDAIVGVRGSIDTTRGDAKVKVDDISDPAALPQRAMQAVHVRLREEVGTEESLHEMREYLLDRRGTCSLYFHVGSNGGEVVVQASSQIRIAGTDEVLAGLRGYPQVADVWTE
jgi:DNA polymerase-3 subunit alpha